jgi:hypothetical protein
MLSYPKPQHFEALGGASAIDATQFYLQCGWNVGPSEVFSLKEERLSSDLGEGIGEAVAEIQARGMTALTEVKESLASQVGLLNGDRFDTDAGPAKKDIALAARIRSDLSFDYYRKLNEVCGADQAVIGIMDQFSKASSFGFPK